MPRGPPKLGDQGLINITYLATDMEYVSHLHDVLPGR